MLTGCLVGGWGEGVPWSTVHRPRVTALRTCCALHAGGEAIKPLSCPRPRLCRWQVGADLDSVQRVLDVGGLLFFIQLFMAFASLYAALFTFPTEFQVRRVPRVTRHVLRAAARPRE